MLKFLIFKLRKLKIRTLKNYLKSNPSGTGFASRKIKNLLYSSIDILH